MERAEQCKEKAHNAQTALDKVGWLIGQQDTIGSNYRNQIVSLK